MKAQPKTTPFARTGTPAIYPDSAHTARRLARTRLHWNEALHGVVGNGIATVFPQAVGMAAAWAPDLIHEEATVVVQKVVIHDETLPIYYFGPPERTLNGKQL
jgi:hypothetical protein